MIKVNLLPTEYRVEEVEPSRFTPQSIFLSIFFFFLLASLYQLFSYVGTRGRYHRMDLEMAQLVEPSKEADQLNQNINAKLLPEIRFFHQYVLPYYQVAEILNVLSDFLPDSVWFSDLRIHREREKVGLELIGFSRITSKQVAVAQIQEYLNLVKGKIELVLHHEATEYEKPTPQEVKAILTTNLREVGGIEAMQFSVSFRSNPVTVQAPPALPPAAKDKNAPASR